MAGHVLSSQKKSESSTYSTLAYSAAIERSNRRTPSDCASNSCRMTAQLDRRREATHDGTESLRDGVWPRRIIFLAREDTRLIVSSKLTLKSVKRDPVGHRAVMINVSIFL